MAYPNLGEACAVLHLWVTDIHLWLQDMRLALALGDSLDVSMPVAAAANESFKKAKAAGRADDDFSAVHAVLKK